MGDAHDRASAKARILSRRLTSVAAVAAASMIALSGTGSAQPVVEPLPDATLSEALPLVTGADLGLVDLPQNIREPQIYNGTDTSWSDHRELAQVRFMGGRNCGGTFLSDSWVLTAAHCVKASFSGDTQGKPDGFYEVQPRDLGAANYSVISVSGTHAVDRIVSHPDHGEVYGFFQGVAYFQFGHHDVALVHLSTPATGVDHAELLTDKAGYSASTPLMAYGWGDTDPGQDKVYPTTPQATQPNLLFPSPDTFPQCDADGPDLSPQPTIICVYARGTGDTTGTGNGDSGGPWYVRGEDGVDRQMGVTSFGRSVGYPTAAAPAGVASVPELYPWIQGVLDGVDGGGTGGGADGGSLGPLNLFGSLTGSAS